MLSTGEVMMGRYACGFWPYWEGLDVELELGFRLASDEPSVIEHRLAKANGLDYGCPPRHWKWRE